MSEIRFNPPVEDETARSRFLVPGRENEFRENR